MNEIPLGVVQELREEMAAIIGRAKAFEYAVSAMIMGSPDHETLQRIWSAVLPTIVDTHSKLDSNSLATYHRAFQDGLAHITHLVEQGSTP